MKNFINRILDLPKLIRTIWFILWIILIILLVMKFCFGIWYPIVIKNEVIIKINNFVDNSWIKYLILGIFYVISLNGLYLISCCKLKYSKFYEPIIVNILILISYYLKYKISSLGFITEMLILVGIPVLYLLQHYKVLKLKLILFPILMQGIIMIWQLNILFVRDLPNMLDNVETLIQIILQLDYYIFLIITWIGVTKMGLISAWFFSKDITVLKAAKEKELARKKPNMDTIAKIDERIAELEKEGK